MAKKSLNTKIEGGTEKIINELKQKHALSSQGDVVDIACNLLNMLLDTENSKEYLDMSVKAFTNIYFKASRLK